ncbi:MAG: mechanosensitive ion channel family protein [Bacteroidales bacterium]|nr:mechanosensitive ion channel family protein [Bacteroidales bacterium]
MEQYQIQLIETAVVFLLIIISRIIAKKVILKARKKFNFQKRRVVIMNRTFNGVIYFLAIAIIMLIWGVQQKQLALFLSSFIAVLGIALFAQWSMLSNITASIILFINHPAKIGDKIVVLDKEFPLTGQIQDIGAFFMSIKTENKEIVTIPNSIIFQKMVKIVAEQKV